VGQNFVVFSSQPRIFTFHCCRAAGAAATLHATCNYNENQQQQQQVTALLLIIVICQ